MLVIGLSGSLLFFPVKIGAHSTCLFHFKQSGKNNSAQSMEHTGFMETKNSGQINGYPANGKLRYYLTHFSFLWWGSLGLSVWSFLALTGFLKKKNYTNKEPIYGERIYD